MCAVADGFFFFQAEDGIRDLTVTGVQTCALPICITLFIAIVVLLTLGFPVAFALAISAALAVFVGGRYPQLIVFKEMFTGIDSFPLMAVPFFILAAELMSGGALTHVLQIGRAHV